MSPVSKPHNPHFFKRTALKPGLVTGTRQAKYPGSNSQCTDITSDLRFGYHED